MMAEHSSSAAARGLLTVTQVEQEHLSTDELSSVIQPIGLQGASLLRLGVKAKKLDFEVGSFSQLKLSVELIDSDELLDENDLKKPDSASFHAMSCGDGKKKKRACNNWTPGPVAAAASAHCHWTRRLLHSIRCHLQRYHPPHHATWLRPTTGAEVGTLKCRLCLRPHTYHEGADLAILLWEGISSFSPSPGAS
ncbi:anamorsin-like [Narcine bancroftii]|uniref:anamorsin-like n=1 Tax=Narcine bancroftii TaxID=1343680 RepID=UPI00383219FD